MLVKISGDQTLGIGSRKCLGFEIVKDLNEQFYLNFSTDR